MRRRLALCAVVGLALSGCALSEPVIEVPAAGLSSMLLVFVPEAGPPRVAAIDLGGGAERFVALPAGDLGAGRLYALGYRCSLERLALPAGWIAPASTGGRALPAAAVVTAAEVVGGVAQAFSPADVGDLASVRLPGSEVRSSPCLELATTSVFALADGTAAQLRFLVGIGGDEVLFATVDGTFRRLVSGVASEVTTLSTSTPHLGAFRDARGALWLAGAGGEVVRGSLAEGFVPAPRLAAGRARGQVWIDGPRDADATPELFAVTDERNFEYFDGTAWTLLYQGTGDPIPTRGGVVWLAPGEALALGLTGSTLLHARDGVLDERPLPLELGDVPTVMAFVPGLGAVVGTEAGAVLIPRGETWDVLETGVRSRISAIAPLGDGLLFGGREGVLAQWHPGADLCPAQPYSGGNVTFIAPLTDGLVLGAIATGAPDVVTTLHLEPPTGSSDECPEGQP